MMEQKGKLLSENGKKYELCQSNIIKVLLGALNYQNREIRNVSKIDRKA